MCTLIGPGSEYPAIVEFAPFLKVPKKRTKKPDPRKGTIESGLLLLSAFTIELTL